MIDPYTIPEDMDEILDDTEKPIDELIEEIENQPVEIEWNTFFNPEYRRLTL
jgi:hypothetical protein